MMFINVSRTIALHFQAAGLKPSSLGEQLLQGIELYAFDSAYEGAEEALVQAIELGYERIETYYTLGLVLYYRERCEEAMPYFNQALAINPEEPNALEGVRLCLQAEQEEATQTP